MRNRDRKGLDDEAIARLERAGAEGEVPLLRWGVPLAQALLDRAGRPKGSRGLETQPRPGGARAFGQLGLDRLDRRRADRISQRLESQITGWFSARSAE